MKLCIGASQESKRLSIGASQVGLGTFGKAIKKKLDVRSWKIKSWWFK
jgi:hypothetical protein